MWKYRTLSVVGAIVAATACSPDQASLERFVAPGSATALQASDPWQQVAARGSGPTNVNSSVLVPRLDAVIAGYLPDFASGELWRFSLRTHRWKRLRADNWPQGKYRRLIHDPSRNLLRTYWDGGGQVYTIPDTGGTWSPEGGAANNDTHYEAYAFMNPLTSQLMLFGGYGFSTFRDDLQAWDGTAWALVGQSAARPEARFGTGTGSVAVDAAGGRAFMGQRHQGIQPGNYDDLWMLRLSDYVWTNLIPATTDSTARLLSAMAYAPHSRRLYRFGGCLPINDPGFCSSYSGETRIANPAAARVRWETLRDGARSPSPRALAGLFFDPVRLRLVLVSGHGADGWQDDIWVRTLP